MKGISLVLLACGAVGAPTPIDRTPASFSCPPGYTLTGKQCIATQTVAPSPFCPAGATLNGAVCVYSSPVEVSCPAGTVNQGGACISEQRSQSTFTCPEAFQAANGQCARTVTVPTRPQCPAGSIPRFGKCFRTQDVDATYTCPAGYTLDGYDCTRTITYDCTGQGKRMLQGRFTKSKDGPVPQHSKGTTSTQTAVLAKTCQRVETIPATKSCPPASIESGKLCRVFVEVPASQICPAEGTSSNCHRTISIPGSYICPPGFAKVCQSATENCPCVATGRSAPIESCPAGTTQEGTVCTATTKASYQCPAGYETEVNGKETTCFRIVTAPVVVNYSITYQCTGKNCEAA